MAKCRIKENGIPFFHYIIIVLGILANHLVLITFSNNGFPPLMEASVKKWVHGYILRLAVLKRFHFSREGSIKMSILP
jgi:hypothetical protein